MRVAARSVDVTIHESFATLCHSRFAEATATAVPQSGKTKASKSLWTVVFEEEQRRTMLSYSNWRNCPIFEN